MSAETASPQDEAPRLAQAQDFADATREILRAIRESRADETPVFDAIIQNACRLCDAPFAGLYMVDEARTHARLIASRGARSEYLQGTDRHWMLTDDSAVPQSIKAGRIVHIHDLADTDAYREGHEQRSAAVDLEGMRSFLAVPLISEDRAIGCLGLYRREVAPFDQAQIALVETFAEQAVIAIENVRQFRELQSRLEREAASSEILEIISRSRDDEKPVFDAILENASRLCDAPLAYLNIATEDRVHVISPAWLGAFKKFSETLGKLRVPLAESRLVLARAISECRVFREDDISDHELYTSGDPNRVSMVEDEGARSLLVVPLIGDGLGIGSITLYRREVKPFTDEDVRLVEGFAAQAAIAIENVRQFRALEARTQEVQALNTSLETRVAQQVNEIERMGRLKRFLPQQVAEAVIGAGDEGLLKSHRALIATLFCDLRGFTAFCETAEPEETIEVLQSYHDAMGQLIAQGGAGVDARAGDGIMVIFNDPLPCDDPAGEAVRLALEMRARMVELCAEWRKLGHRLGFGCGISLGYATVGVVGSQGRFDYTASGSAVNLASRLCDQAEDGEILLSPRAFRAVEGSVSAEPAGALELKGFQAPVEIARVLGSR